MFIDSHCHLDKLAPTKQGQLDSILAAAVENRVNQVICICVSLEALPSMRDAIAGQTGVFSTVGVHPLQHDCMEPDAAKLCELATEQPHVVAIGETGLDYFKQEKPEFLDQQRLRFRQHIRAAVELNKPVVIHTRAAREDTLAILREEGAERCGGVIHCFTEDWAFAEAAMELGFYISLSGIVTFGSAKDLQAVAKRLPQDRILIETDAPWLAPVPHRGKENQPAWVADVASFLAKLRGETVEEVAAYSSRNAQNCFKLDPEHVLRK